jgi:lipid-A-disaccharide synthase
MRLAKKLHREGFKIVYYISPQVWAWRRYRVRALRRDVDRMLVILPFEEEFYKKAGVEVQYVGHPLANAVQATATREEFCRRNDLNPALPIIALLPGSRQKEIHYHLPVMLDAAARLRELPIADCRLSIDKSQLANPATSHPQSPIANRQSCNPQFVIPLASTISREQVQSAIHHTKPGSDVDAREQRLSIKIIEGETYNALRHSEVAVVASGTATVEAALADTPMVIIYRGSELNWRLIRPLIHLDTFGMVNLIAGRRIVPELMQHEATGENITREVGEMLSNSGRISQIRRDLARVRDMLSRDGRSGPERAAQAVIEMIGSR